MYIPHPSYHPTRIWEKSVYYEACHYAVWL